MRTLLVGCGYVGLALGKELVRQGHEVYGLRRSVEAGEALRSVGVQPLMADVTQPEQLQKLAPSFDWVVNLVASTKGGDAADYRRVYLEGTRNLLAWLGPTPPRKFVYTSSTSVYGQTDGSQVKETSPTEPLADTAAVLVQTEKVLMDAASSRKFPAVILRVAGIYGPERGHFFQQYLRNEARIEGRGERILNMIHLDDVIGVIVASLASGRAGEVYNAVDDEPVMQVHFYRWLSETLGKWMPPIAEVPPDDDRKRGLTNKRVINRKLKMELGYRFRYPTFRQGYTAEIQRLERAGLLNIEPEPR